MQLSDRALLTQLNISQWTARKYDKKATSEVAAANGTAMDVGRYNKSLLPMNDSLSNVHQKTGAVRAAYYAATLPWGLEGTQMLPSANYLAFMTEFRKQKAEWQLLVDRFLFDYERLVRDASRFLGTLYDPADYPTLEELRLKFKIDMVIMPVPSDDFRVQLADEELSGLQADMQRRITESAGEAMKEAWRRLFERVEKIVERLSDPKNRFNDSLIENAKEICAVLPRLNFSDDPNLEAMRTEVEGKLAAFTPEVLRADPVTRAKVASDAKDIMDKMSVFMGGV